MDDGIIFVVVILLIALAFIAGCSYGKHQIKLDATGSGVGEFYISTNYLKEFRWKKNDKQ